jgi:hypothetical protein
MEVGQKSYTVVGIGLAVLTLRVLRPYRNMLNAGKQHLVERAIIFPLLFFFFNFRGILSVGVDRS